MIRGLVSTEIDQNSGTTFCENLMVAPININHLPANTRREVSKMGQTDHYPIMNALDMIFIGF